jgi:N-acylneuraminate cytidylyltransferase
VVVSTDDEEIAAIARQYGAETPFLRPAELSQDHTADLPVFQHALGWLAENEGRPPEIVVQLRPTSPLRRVSHIDQAICRLLERPEADSVRTVCVPFQNPFKMWRIGPDGFMLPLLGAPLLGAESPEPYNMPRQLLPEVFWQTGYVDVVWSDTVLQKASMTGERILPLVIDPSEWIDIDSPDDWRRAERLLESGEITFDDLGFNFGKNSGG